MLGAVHGRRALPQRWIEGLVHREEVQSAAHALYANSVLRTPNGSSSGSRPVLRSPPPVTPPIEPVELSADLASFAVSVGTVVDIVTAAGIADVGLPPTAPLGVLHEECWPIARAAYYGGMAGIACLSSAEARVSSFVGEEFAYCDSQPPLTVFNRQPFSSWYPDTIP
jgi:hypothetical protein